MSSQPQPPPSSSSLKEREEVEVAVFKKKKKNLSSASIRRSRGGSNNNKRRKKTSENEEEIEREIEEEDKGDDDDDDDDDEDNDDVSARLQKAKERLNERQEMSKVGQSKGIDSELLLLGDAKEREEQAREREFQERKEKNGGEVQLAFGAGAKGGLTIMHNENNNNEDPQMQLYVEHELEKRRKEHEEARQQKEGDSDDGNDERRDVGDFHSLQNAKEDLWKTETYYADAEQKRKDDIARKETVDRNLTGITEVEISQFDRAKMLQATEDAKKRIQRQKDDGDDEGEWIDLGVKSDEALEIEKWKESVVAKAKGLGFRTFGKKRSR
jgi:hypothetical protein